MASQESSKRPVTLPQFDLQSSKRPATVSQFDLRGEGSEPRGPLSLPTFLPPTPAEAAQVSAGLNAGPTLFTLLQALRRRWLLAFTVALSGGALAVFAIWLLVPPQYTASSRLMVASRAPGGILTHDNDDTDFVLYKQNQVATITSTPVLSGALNRNEVRNLPLVRDQVNPIPWLEKALKIDFLISPEIMRVSLSGTDPEPLAPMVNAVVDNYLKEQATKEQTKRALLMAALKKNQTDEENKLKERQKALRKVEQDLKLEDGPTTQAKLTASLTELAQMKKDLRELQLKINEARGVSLTEIEAHAKTDPAVLELLKHRSEVQKTIAEIRRTAQPHLQNGLLEAPTRELEAVDKAYAALLRDLRPNIEKELRAQGDRRVTFLQNQEANLLKDIERTEAETQRIKRATVEVDSARRAIQQTETALDKLGEQIAAIGLEPALGGRVTKIQPADTPRNRDMTRSLLFSGAGGVSIFGLLLLGVAFLEYRVRRINAVDEVVQGLGLPLVGTLPALPARARQPLSTSAGKKDLFWQNRVNEAIDAIRTLLLHAARSEPLQVIMVTSAAGGEGKTSVASHLAASLARAWRKTLLVDGDLRNPAAHTLFELPLEPGFSEVLRGEVSLADAIRPTPLSRLWLMPAGNWDSHAVQALAQEAVKSQFAQLKQQYDFIIVDSCPVLPVADSLLLGQHVDAVVFSILCDVSRMPSVHAAQQRLGALGIRTLGAVVIGASAEAGSGSYHYPNVTGR